MGESPVFGACPLALGIGVGSYAKQRFGAIVVMDSFAGSVVQCVDDVALENPSIEDGRRIEPQPGVVDRQQIGVDIRERVVEVQVRVVVRFLAERRVELSEIHAITG